ncbi:MFS transporter [Actinomadura sp. WMMB 499]|uniref:MFS transporter n=1 Tax=Actinomadura sp. WMMB 499 TaxID=1219491 RepID=UPI001248F143|nr:MFS transporter [Actinomadura sp. WMMB 499]QFG25029.1 multidrug efflux MFS transporter [Actinomadura sp. WMMB 499]
MSADQPPVGGAAESRRGALAALLPLVPLLLGTFTGTLANTIVNVPLSMILDDLGVPLSAGALLVVAFTVTFAVLLPISGWLGDRYGHRRVFAAAMAVLGTASAGAALAPGLGALVAVRAVQGAATAAMLPTVMALISALFDGAARGRALALWAATNGIGQAAGPALGGGLATWLGWRAVFWPIVPVGLAAAVAAVRLVPCDRPRAVPLEWRGAALLTLAAGLALGAASAVAPLGLGSPAVWLGAPAALLAAGAFLLAERGRADAFLPPRLLLEIRYLRSCLTVLAQMFCLGATLLGVPLYLTTERGAGTLTAGALLLCLPIAMAVLAPPVGAAMERLGARPVLRAGLVLLVAGQALAAAVLTDRYYAVPPLLAALLLTGAGVALVQTPAATGATRSRAGRYGAGLGLFNLVRFGGSALGAAWVAAVLDRGPSFGAVFAGCAAVAALGLLSSFAGPDPAPPPGPPAR